MWSFSAADFPVLGNAIETHCVTNHDEELRYQAGGSARLITGPNAIILQGLLGIVWVNVHDNQMDIAETAHRDG